MKLKARPVIITIITEIVFLALSWIIFNTFTYTIKPDLTSDTINVARYYPFVKTEQVKYKVYEGEAVVVMTQSEFNKASKDFDDIYLVVRKPTSEGIKINIWGIKKPNEHPYYHSSVLLTPDLSKSTDKKKNFTISTRKVDKVTYNTRSKIVTVTYKADENNGFWCLLVWAVLCSVAILIPLWIKVNGGQENDRNNRQI